MMYWAIQTDGKVPDVFFPERDSSKQSHEDGINLLSVRKVLEASATKPILFQLGATDNVTILRDFKKLPDLLFWSWIPIFSDRAHLMAVQLGCDEGDFLACQFESNEIQKFFLHLPKTQFEFVNFEKSKFLYEIPIKPPIPHHIVSLVLLNSEQKFPPFVRASIPKSSQALGDLFMRDDFKTSWEREKYTGADFRKIM